MSKHYDVAPFVRPSQPASGWLDYFIQRGIRISPERDGMRASLGLFKTTSEIDRLIEAIHARSTPYSRAREAAPRNSSRPSPPERHREAHDKRHGSDAANTR